MSGIRAARKQVMGLVLIDSRALERECLTRGIETAEPSIAVDSFKSVADWIEGMGSVESPTAILYNTQGRRMSDPEVKADLSKVVASGSVPIIVLSPFEEFSEIVASIDLGARAYIPASLGIEATLIAVRLAGSGGVFIPTASLLAVRDIFANKGISHELAPLTQRQSAVAEALRRGKPNKLIAYDLNMCESTVKVHIRNIMKKLQARNRTEAGYKLNLLMSGSPVRNNVSIQPRNVALSLQRPN